MYCPKCGKQVPDNAAFCSNCGANLQGGTSARKSDNNAASNIGWIVYIIVCLVMLFWAFTTYSNDTSNYPFIRYNYKSPLSEHEILVMLVGLFGFGGVIGGICGLCAPKLRKSKQLDLTEQRELNATPPTAQKLTMQGHGSVIKCSRCGKVQTSNRTMCQSCGAKFVE